MKDSRISIVSIAAFMFVLCVSVPAESILLTAEPDDFITGTEKQILINSPARIRAI